MANIHISQELEKRLESFAKATGQKPDTLASKLLRQSLDEKEQSEQEYIEDEKSWQACEKGQYIDNERVMEWLDSWGTVNELPCPTIK